MRATTDRQGARIRADRHWRAPAARRRQSRSGAGDARRGEADRQWRRQGSRLHTAARPAAEVQCREGAAAVGQRRTGARITILGAGRGVVAGGMSADLTRDEVVRTLLDGFLPAHARDDLPARDSRVGCGSLGSPTKRNQRSRGTSRHFSGAPRETRQRHGTALSGAVQRRILHAGDRPRARSRRARGVGRNTSARSRKRAAGGRGRHRRGFLRPAA